MTSDCEKKREEKIQREKRRAGKRHISRVTSRVDRDGSDVSFCADHVAEVAEGLTTDCERELTSDCTHILYPRDSLLTFHCHISLYFMVCFVYC